MDVKHERLLISLSLRAAEETKSEKVRDTFLTQASNQQARLDEYLKKNPVKPRKRLKEIRKEMQKITKRR